MQDEYLCNADGEMLFALQQGALRFVTELGVIEAAPGEIVVIPRGMKMRVELVDGPARGYLGENYGGAFRLPERGPIGANCLANSRDFLTPKAHYEDREAPSTLYLRAQGVLWKTQLSASPLDVVAWHGNYAPYKYDLRRFSPVGSIHFDHPDPSIFTVLTAPSDTPSMANIDLVIFPERWLTMENTFRPPWYHVNIMSEFMGLLYGQYDAKPHGFKPGGVSLHNSMLPHGPDMDAFEHASTVKLEPVKLSNTMAFMFDQLRRFMRFHSLSSNINKVLKPKRKHNKIKRFPEKIKIINKINILQNSFPMKLCTIHNDQALSPRATRLRLAQISMVYRSATQLIG
jgi:homogentisate 1,2-dioxygenase